MPLSAGVWLAWPWLRPLPPPRAARPDGLPEVITVFVEDPARVVAALALWRRTPGATLVLQGRAHDQAVSRQSWQTRGLWPPANPRLVTLTRGCDTVGQLTALHDWLRRYPSPGRLTVVTSPAHLPRSLAIARIVEGAQGWRVEGLPAITGDNRPESALRRWRDQLRSQIWRLTRWDGNAGFVCPARDARWF